MKRKTKLYFYLILAFAAIPFLKADVIVVKAVTMVYVIYLIFRKDAVALPALIVLASFLSNIYIGYFAIIALSLISFRELKIMKVHGYLIVLLSFLPITLFYFFTNFLILNISFGTSFNQYQFYFSLFSFFYGVLIYKSFDIQIIRGLILTFIILYLFQVVSFIFSDGFFIRLIFFIIPFILGWIGYNLFFNKRSSKALLKAILGIAVLISTFTLRDLTFTILLTILLTFGLYTTYFLNKNILATKISGLVTYIFLFLLIVYAINNYNDHDYSMFSYSMKEVETFNDFLGRINMKIFDDRGPIWAGAWNQIKEAEAWLPPVGIQEIIIEKITGHSMVFEFHAHNLYLELLRTNGYIMGSVLSILFIKMNLLGRKIFYTKNTQPELILLSATSIAGNLIGSMTGIYVLLYTYAILGLTIVGVCYASFHTEQIKTFPDRAAKNNSVK